ncbi:MAG: hypothetical protein U0903_20925 [Planctomycetales bacterium]
MIEAINETKSMPAHRKQALRLVMWGFVVVCVLQLAAVVSSFWEQGARRAELRELETQIKVLEAEVAKLQAAPAKE